MGKSLITPFRLIIFTVALAVSSCVWIRHKESSAFDATSPGDTEAQVLERFGKPDHREPVGQPYLRYTGAPCNAPCHTRLWWEDDLLPGVGAISVELDINGRVISKYRWVSP